MGRRPANAPTFPMPRRRVGLIRPARSQYLGSRITLNGYFGLHRAVSSSSPTRS